MKSVLDRALEQERDVKKGLEAEANPGGRTASPDDDELKHIVEALRVKIAIVGCGGGGSNTVRRLYQSGIVGATLVAANSDAKHLLSIQAPNKVLLGRTLTKGLGAGAIPEVGRKAAEEARDDLMKYVDGQNIVFVTAGMGGGTGTGTAPLVAELARQRSSLVLGVVTLPFKAEGRIRTDNAVKGINRLREFCDTTIVVPNDKLLEIVPKLPLEAAFKVADEVLMQSIKGITEIITKPGLVNVDFNDIMTIMKNGGVAMIGIGESRSDDNRIEEAVNEALSSPLLGDLDTHEARGALIRVVGGNDLTLAEAEKAAEMVGKCINPMARIIWGCTIEPECEGIVKVMVVITGVKSNQVLGRDSFNQGILDKVR
ncbi:MAG: cell division protein FtsZ [Methanomassiliicoccales archaeon]|jgi:cell division protein FtsZ|nr:cell division protein FtsZ [Methanomassiliicoccales archaeon]